MCSLLDAQCLFSCFCWAATLRLKKLIRPRVSRLFFPLTGWPPPRSNPSLFFPPWLTPGSETLRLNEFLRVERCCTAFVPGSPFHLSYRTSSPFDFFSLFTNKHGLNLVFRVRCYVPLVKGPPVLLRFLFLSVHSFFGFFFPLLTPLDQFNFRTFVGRRLCPIRLFFLMFWIQFSPPLRSFFTNHFFSFFTFF